MQQWKDPDSFGGHSGKKTKSFESPWDDDDKSSSKSNGGKNARDDFDDPGSASEAGEVFRDNLSDADARSICNAWKSEHNVVVGVSWGSLPFQLQQKWNQYACDMLLSS